MHKRYSFQKVAAVTAVCYISAVLLQVFSLFLIQSKELNEKNWFSLQLIGKTLLSYLFMTGYFYFFVNRFYFFILNRKKFWIAYLPASTLAFIAYFVYQGFSILFLKDQKMSEELTTRLLVFSVCISSLLMTGLALLIAYLTSLRDDQKQRRILERQKMELEVQHSLANLNFLKAQINPHFLHNTLNFFYAKALPVSAELSEGILCLADIMRYALNETGANGKTLLDDEIAHLSNLIKINQFRFNNQLNVHFEVTGNTTGSQIVPFVLITLAENAFKHGDLKNEAYPITIRVVVEEGSLYFFCHNKKRPGSKDKTTGIGLQNILKRLEIMYGNTYSYAVKDEPDFYTVELKINSL